MSINDLDKRLITGLLIPMIQERYDKELVELKRKYDLLCKLVDDETDFYVNTCPECNKIDLIYYIGNNPTSIKCDSCIK